MSALIYLADDDPALLEVFSAFLESAALELTMTEFALLRCLLEARGSAVSRDTLLSKV